MFVGNKISSVTDLIKKMHLVFPKQILLSIIYNNLILSHIKQDAREAMRVFFSVLTKRICMHKTKFLMNIFKYCFKDYIKLHEFANCNSANYDA